MRLHSLIIDDFLGDFERWRSWFDSAQFLDIQSPVDQVTYPNICTELPLELISEIEAKLARNAAATRINFLFARLSPAGITPPHWAHNDASMGTLSMMLYLNRADDCQGGTHLLEHVHYGNDVSLEEWQRDTNQRELWRPVFECAMRPNRAFIFPAEQWHAAMPADGFGVVPADARLVLTAFFS